MKKVIGIIRNECGAIISLVLFDLNTRKKYKVEPGKDAEALYGRYPVYVVVLAFLLLSISAKTTPTNHTTYVLLS